MSEIIVSGANLGNDLANLLTCQAIQPGDAPSYQVCKTILEYHPLGAKMAESPVRKAQAKQRKISVPKGPEERLVEAFQAEWKALGAERSIFNTMRLSRAYGVASVALLAEGVPTDRPIDYKTLPGLNISFNVFDPLNTSGSLVLNQDPNAMDFQKPRHISVGGKAYHRSRAVVAMNEDPIYIGYTSSAFGYVGRSVYQRALFPLKSFINSMVTDDMVTKKAGVLIAKMKQQGSIIDAVMAAVQGVKRQLLKEAATNNVISISSTDNEAIETLNMQNLDGAYGMARKNILENIAVSADMPAQLLNSETFAEGFGEGTEDAKAVADYVDTVRRQMDPLYDFFDKICMYRAWDPAFFKTIQAQFPESFDGKTHTQAFYEWTNSFAATWPSLLSEPESEKIKVEETKYKTIIGVLEVMLPELGPVNRAKALQWAADNCNENKMLFTNPLVLDPDELLDWQPPQPQQLRAPEAPPAFSGRA